ncbi:hypothetical protein MLD38_030925 [Melastoma candidum]|uniref:Uncharacterized protein n=1 Tax=Melastoma candidum TaxID=119954 RepID=A0ACB9MMT4_9MYRT|nr:hypothetical protein MLD38_030925 [Melastoma candidum]
MMRTVAVARRIVALRCSTAVVSYPPESVLAAVRDSSVSSSPLNPKSSSTPLVGTLRPIAAAYHSSRPSLIHDSFLRSRCTTPPSDTHDDDECDHMELVPGDGGSDDDVITRVDETPSETVPRDVETVMRILRELRGDLPRMRAGLDSCGLVISGDLVSEVLSRFRNDWEAAFTFFVWATGRSPGYSHSVRQYHSMISILAKAHKFDTAWSLIEEMRGDQDGRWPGVVTPHTLMIMIRRYCAVHDVGRAINTFYAYKKYGFEPGMEEFEGLLSALCRYRNVREAEHLLFCNRNVFPLGVKTFNIVLNGWCNVVVSTKNGERIWREMGKRGIKHDVVSFGCIISCYSKSRNFNMVMKLFNRMKDLGIDPDRKVYNAVIHALAKARLVGEARNVMAVMEEKGIMPNVITYNSLIRPLCQAREIDEVKKVFEEMLLRGIQPSVRTYHVFFQILRTTEEVFGLLEKMKTKGCPPNYDTYIMLIRKLCRWRQVDCVYKLWHEMDECGLSPDRSCYIVLIHGLFLNGKLEDAYKYFLEMRDRHLLPDLKTEEMFRAWISGREVIAERTIESPAGDGNRGKSSFRKLKDEKDFLRRPENRKVVRERGYSFWGQ